MNGSALTNHTATRFVGRRRELKKLRELLKHPNIHLITVLGSGGIGKTRLAIEAANGSADLFPNGIFIAELITDSSCNQMVEHILDQLPIQYDSQSLPEQQVIKFFSDKKCLLILDSFEHLITCAEWVLKLIQSCPTLTTLITSRAALNLQCEWVMQLDGLSVPTSPRSIVDDEEYDAVQLFALCAQQADQNFELEAKRAEIIRICQLVEGMPLAIELAAAWIRALPPGEIAAEIQHNLNLLSTKHRDVESRHRSMRAVFDHSWELLSSEEQAAFTSLTVFRGGFTREAAQVVAGINLQILDTLIDKSLVRHQRDDRYDIHELLRQYGETRLEEYPDEHQAVLKQCATYYARFLNYHKQHLSTMQDGMHLDQINQEIGNIRRAINYLLSKERVADVSDSLTTLTFLYFQSGWLYEGIQDFSRIEADLRRSAPNASRDLALARTLNGLAYWKHSLNQQEQAKVHLEEALSLLRKNSQATAVDTGLGLLFLGRTVRALGNVNQASTFIDKAGHFFEDFNWAYGRWLATLYRGELAYGEGAFELAHNTWLQALDSSVHTDFVAGRVSALGHVALAEIQLGLLGAARLNLIKAIDLCVDHQVIFPVPVALAAVLALLDHYDDLEWMNYIAHLVLTHTASDFQVRRYVQATHNYPNISSENQISYDRHPAELRYKMNFIDHADLQEIKQKLIDLADFERARPELTKREQEVLMLMADGATNLQIAQQLEIAEGTVKRYSHHLFGKLGAQNRAEAVFRAAELRIL